MAKFIVIKKKTILSSLIVLCLSIFLLCYFFIFTNDNYSATNFTLSTFTKDTDSLDLNGDGEMDSLNILSEKNHYIINIKTQNKDFSLKSKDKSNLLASKLSNWPIKINTLDLSRDGTPEIIIRGSKDNSPINYIFTWDNGEFNNIYTSQDNILGILDSTNSRTPKILSLSSSKGDSSVASFVFNGSNIKDISFSKQKVPGLASIQSFIDIIQAQYELSEPPNIFSSNISSDELGLLWGLDKENYRYSFQNGYFTDTKWDKNGDVTTLNWVLSFEAVNKSKSNSPKQELLLYLTVERDPYKEFKILSIRKS
ncbi:hypothetical protein JCM1393_19000 [Clostridium carnis]